MSENLIKSITAHECPHCKETMFIESHMTPPVVKSIFTTDDMKKAKKDCLDRVDSLDVEQEKKDMLHKWVEDEETVFGPDEVESIVMSLLKKE